ncbi:hypothetical protein AN933_26865 [Mycobacterium intracellulare subsp. chimaera]|nr:hypothetical protein AN933_26865 [Mycobacterium intracellulare subsp. chimaera]
MMWCSGYGWGWLGVIVNVPTMVAFWGAVVTASVLAVRFHIRGGSEPSVPTLSDSTRAEDVSAARFTAG